MLALPLPAEAGGLKKVRVVYQTFAIFENVCRRRLVEVGRRFPVARLLRRTGRSCNIQPTQYKQVQGDYRWDLLRKRNVQTTE
jgi:hypothetical protein